MGDRDRRSRPHPRVGLARILHGDQWPAGAGGDGVAGGHAGRAHRGARRARLRAGRDLAGGDRHEPAAEAPVGGGAADRAHRRQPLVGGGERRGGALCRTFCAPGCDHVPARASVRSVSPLLRRRSRHRAQSQAAGAREGRRRHPAGRRAAGRDALAELHAPRHSGTPPDPGARVSRRRGARPGLRAAAGDQRRADRLCGCARRPAAAERDQVARRDADRARRFPGLDRQADHGAGRRQSRRDCCSVARKTPGRRGDPWATACRRRSA